MKPFIYQHDWNKIEFWFLKNDWKKYQSNNKSIAFNILYVSYNTEKIRHAYESKYNLNQENQTNFLMIIDGEKWHYHAVKKLHCKKMHCLEE